MDSEQKFEYKTVKLKRPPSAQALNKSAGDKGWQLVQILRTNDGCICYFKKEIYQFAYLNDGEIIEIEE